MNVSGIAIAASPACVPHRVPNTSPSMRLFDASRFAPCRPDDVTSPAAHRPGSVVLPRRSVVTPPTM